MSKELSKVQAEIEKIRKVMSEDPKYNNQVFKKGTKVEIDASILAYLIQTFSNAQRLNETLKSEVTTMYQMMTMIDPAFEKVGLDLMRVMKEATDNGLTETKKQETDGTVTEDN